MLSSSDNKEISGIFKYNDFVNRRRKGREVSHSQSTISLEYIQQLYLINKDLLGKIPSRDQLLISMTISRKFIATFSHQENFNKCNFNSSN